LTLPSAKAAQVCEFPAATFLAFVVEDTVTAELEFVVLPLPS
jgi:hypothetical protein